MKSFDELMRAVNCTKFSERWREIYDAAMSDFSINGCKFADPAYYDELGDAYGILNVHRDAYKKAAAEVGNNPDLSAFLSLVCYALKDLDASEKEFTAFTLPTSPDGGHNLAYDMLPALALCSVIPSFCERLKSLNLPDDIIRTMLNDPETYIDEYRRRNGGAYGSSLIAWGILILNCKIFRLGRLNFEIFKTFTAKASVFRNANGDEAILADGALLHKSGYALGAKGFEDESDSWQADIEETADAWTGFSYDRRGYVRSEKVSLSKSEWTRVLTHGDPVVAVHIPSGGSLSPEAVNDALSKARYFLKTYFPDYCYKAFTCHSWMLSPELERLVGADSNIVKFGNRFNRISVVSQANDIFYFVFLITWGADIVYKELPENSRLEKALKEHYLNGAKIYEVYGYFMS